jgi:predicted amidohydrolase
MLGIIERPADRGGHSVYCSRIHVGADGKVASVHRKLLPTYEERLSWVPGDGHGLQVHPVGPFTVGGLNCYENWMPLSRAALYAQGEDLHVALWPGSLRNTIDTTRFLAREGRSYVLAVSGLMRREDVPAASPAAAMLERCPEVLADGGSCIAGPDGGVGGRAGHGTGALDRCDSGAPRGAAGAAELRSSRALCPSRRDPPGCGQAPTEHGVVRRWNVVLTATRIPAIPAISKMNLPIWRTRNAICWTLKPKWRHAFSMNGPTGWRARLVCRVGREPTLTLKPSD